MFAGGDRLLATPSQKGLLVILREQEVQPCIFSSLQDAVKQVPRKLA